MEVYKVIHTANTEEPDCGRCANVTSATQEYCNECGKACWCHYKRTSYETKEDQS